MNMIFSNKIIQLYKSRMFCRYDETGTAFYFSADDFKGLNKEPFSFVTPKGNRLQGYFYSYENPIPGRLIIFDHGMGGGHRAYMREIEMLAGKGYLVFSYDHTGCMESEGESTGGFATSLADLDAAVGALKADERFKNMKLSVVGHSWGAYAAQNVCNFRPDLAHIIAISGPLSAESMINQSFGGILKFYRRDIMAAENKANDEKYVSCDAITALGKTNAQILIIHSSDDKIVKRESNFDKIKTALESKPNISFLLADGKAHNPNYTAEAVIYMGNYFKALNRKLKKGELSTDEQKKAFLAQYDWHYMTAQDEAVWAEIFKTLEK